MKFETITLPSHPLLAKFGHVTEAELAEAYNRLDDFQKDGAKSTTLAGLISKQVQRAKGVQCPLLLIPVLNAAITAQIEAQ